jgi:pSer/pThr/pTyr-binding forkhead associated (FHA) protein
MASLYVQRGPGQGNVIELEGERLWVGRGPETDITLDDRTVSREHAVLIRRRAGWYLQDLESQNGTFINDQPVVTARLVNGDEVSFGNVVAIFKDTGPQPPMVAAQHQDSRGTEVTQIIRLNEIEKGGTRCATTCA